MTFLLPPGIKGLNISSLSAHINELKTLLSQVDTKFDIICISESRISKKNSLTTNIDTPGYNIEQTPTESSAGGSLIYISQKLSYKVRKDLQLHRPKELESVFIELLIPSKSSLILGTIYKHPSMQHFNFNNDFMKKLFNKISLANKRSLIADDFNLNLIKYRQIIGVNQFLEVMLTSNFTWQITLPTRINQKSATPIDNIFLNYHEHQYISSNLTNYISDHLPQFIIVENLLENIIDRNGDQIERRDYNNFNIYAFKRDIDEIHWSLAAGNTDINLSFEIFLRLIGKILDKHAPLKKKSRKKQKEKIKPWVTRGIRHSMKIRDTLYKQFIK